MVSRRLNGADGGFAGIAGASISLDYFLRFYGTLAVADGGAVTLRNRDGVILARQPATPDLVGQTGPSTSVVDAVRAGAREGTLAFLATPGIADRIISFRMVEGTPFIVSVSVGRAAVTDRWLQGTLNYALMTFVLMAVAAVLIWGVAREIGRRLHADRVSLRNELAAASARRHLADAVDVLPAGLLLFDADEVLILANGRYTEMFPEMRRYCTAGTSLTDLIRTVGELNLVETTSEGSKAWVDRRLALHRRDTFDCEMKTADGRWFQSIIRRTSDGGRVSAFIDISESKRTQEALLQSQKLEVVGQLTGGAASES